jgi:hypothetical protein
MKPREAAVEACMCPRSFAGYGARRDRSQLIQDMNVTGLGGHPARNSGLHDPQILTYHPDIRTGPSSLRKVSVSAKFEVGEPDGPKPDGPKRTIFDVWCSDPYQRVTARADELETRSCASK